ncbi:hypothetical protein Tco_0952686 [Tanacetum coccineum]|uniref:Uncharacterized protein n=1 Tax=Tanacetum coccineum TaxID=301880 RepID=A0ABQ5DXM5_9ASTR
MSYQRWKTQAKSDQNGKDHTRSSKHMAYVPTSSNLWRERKYHKHGTQSPLEHPKDKTGLDASAKLTRSKLNKHFGDADLLKDNSGPDSIKGQSDKGDEGLCYGGTKLKLIFITAEIRKKSPRKQNFNANHKGKYKSIKGKRSKKAEQVRFGTVIGMIRGYRSRKRPHEQAEQWLDNEISFPSTSGCQLVDSPIILEAVIEGYLVRKIYVDGGSSSETAIDMIGIPRFIAEHELKTYPHIEPMVQRKRSIAPDKRKVVKEEVAE